MAPILSVSSPPYRLTIGTEKARSNRSAHSMATSRRGETRSTRLFGVDDARDDRKRHLGLTGPAHRMDETRVPPLPPTLQLITHTVVDHATAQTVRRDASSRKTGQSVVDESITLNRLVRIEAIPTIATRPVRTRKRPHIPTQTAHAAPEPNRRSSLDVAKRVVPYDSPFFTHCNNSSSDALHPLFFTSTRQRTTFFVEINL